MASKSIDVLSQRVQNAAKVMKIAEEYVWAGLAELGIEEDDLSLLEAETTREGDARRVFVEHAIGITDKPSVKVKPARFVAGWAVLKGKADRQEKKEGQSDVAALVGHLRPIHTFKDRELLAQYGPEASSEVIDELLKRSRGRPFVIYMPDGETVDVDNTLLMLRTARRHETKQYHGVIRDGGSMVEVRVYRADEFPKTWFEECPVHTGVMLTFGYCDKCENTWEGIEDAVRVVARVARDMNAIKYGSLADINDLLVRLREDGGKHLMAIPAVRRRHEELGTDNDLPKLKKRQSTTKNGMQDPLFQHKIY